jgi:hypothetical protein
MKFNKQAFLKTEFGTELVNCIKCWDKWITEGDREAAVWCQAQWEVYQLALKQFYQIEYYFTRTNTFFGICTADQSNYLFKVEREA